MSERDRLLEEMARWSPPGSSTEGERSLLNILTDAVERLSPAAQAEYWRFVNVKRRNLGELTPASVDRLRGNRVVVTGATGTIGTELLRLLVQLDPADLRSLSRGYRAHRYVDGVFYDEADVTHLEALTRRLRAARPDVVFHLAAVRSPKEAERAPDVAIRTNVSGTANVIRACRDAGVPLLVQASTGKAVRFYTRDIYAATKKAGEQLLAGAASEMATGAARFTHVVDNSLVLAKLKGELRAGLMTLHGPHIPLHAQSARESAELLVLAAGEAHVGASTVVSLRNLEEPFDLTDIALGLRAESGRSVPLTFVGFEPGYEERPYAGMYDFEMGETGPLVNCFEARRTSGLLAERVNRTTVPSSSALPELAALLSSPSVPALAELSRAAWEQRAASEPADLVDGALARAATDSTPSSDHLTTTQILRGAAGRWLNVG